MVMVLGGGVAVPGGLHPGRGPEAADCRGQSNLNAEQSRQCCNQERDQPPRKHSCGCCWLDSKVLLGDPSKGTDCDVVVMERSPELWP